MMHTTIIQKYICRLFFTTKIKMPLGIVAYCVFKRMQVMDSKVITDCAIQHTQAKPLREVENSIQQIQTSFNYIILLEQHLTIVRCLKCGAQG